MNACKLYTMVMKLLHEGAVSMATDAIYVCEIQHKKQQSIKEKISDQRTGTTAKSEAMSKIRAATLNRNHVFSADTLIFTQFQILTIESMETL